MQDDAVNTWPVVPSKPFELKGWHVAIIAASFFLVVAGVNGFMLRAAITTMPGLDARNGYDVSQRYNAEIAAAAVQDARGWQAEIDMQALRRASGVIVRLTDKSSAPLAGRIVTVRLAHPTLRAADRVLSLGETAPGRYEADAAGLSGGGWTMQLEVRDAAAGPVLFASRNRVVVSQ